MNEWGRFRTYSSYGDISGNIWVGGDFNGWMYAGSSYNSHTCAITGTIDIDGQLGSNGRLFAYSQGGISGTIDIGNGIASGGSIRTYRGPLAGDIIVTGDVQSGVAVRVGESTSTAYNNSNMTGTASITINGNMDGGRIRVYGTQGILSGATIDVTGDLINSSYIRVDRAGADMAGDITIGNDLNSSSYLFVADDMNGSIGIGRDLIGSAYVDINGDMGAGSSISVGRDIISSRGAGAIDIEGNVAGQITVTRNMTDNRKINIAGNLAAAGRIDVDGTLSGDILIGGDSDGFVQINDMAATGNLIAALFGDVEVLGDFLGRIGDSGTADGAGNTLTLHSSGNTINGQVYRQTPGPAGYQTVGPGDDPAFDGAFAAIEDVDL